MTCKACEGPSDPRFAFGKICQRCAVRAGAPWRLAIDGEPACADCGGVISKYGRRGFCKTCYERRRAAQTLPDVICVDCGDVVNSTRGTRSVARCVSCRKIHNRRQEAERQERIKNDPERLAAQRESHRRSKAKWMSKDRSRRLQYATRYRRVTGIKITWDEMAAMLEAQGGRCAICERLIAYEPGDGTVKNAHLDHCHTNGRVRGWLCSPCNRALGMLGDNADTLRRAADYIEQHTP